MPVHLSLHRAILVCGILIAPLTGCTEFQKVCTAKWLETDWQQAPAEHAVNDMVTLWDNRIRITEDSVNGGRQMPGLAGRLYLFNDGAAVEARGKVMVQVFDMTNGSREQPPQEVGTWTFPTLALKQLRKKDAVGDGYTLFLPWPADYPHAVREVKVQVCYLSEKGSPRYSSPAKVTLQSDDLPPPIVQRRTLMPGAQPTLTPVAAPTLPGRN